MHFREGEERLSKNPLAEMQEGKVRNMSELYMMVTITDRKLTKKFVEFYQQEKLEVSVATVGAGTAASEILDYFGLEGTEKVVLFHVVTDDTWKRVKLSLQRKMKIDIPGVGIAFLIPLSSIGGK